TNDDGCNCDKSADFLMTPSFSLTGQTSVFLSFDAYYFSGTYQGATESATLKSSTNGGSSWNTVTTIPANTNGGWQSQYIDISSLAGQSNVMLGILYNDNGGYLFGFGIDNFSVFVPAAADLQLTTVTPVAGSASSYGTVSSNVTLGGSVFNHSGTTVTSFSGTYSVDGGAPVNQTFNVNIAPFASGNFSFTTPYSIASVGDHAVALNVDITGDANPSDNAGTTSIGGASFIPSHVLTIEEGTGTWCGWCPRGAVYMDSMRAVNPTTTALIAVHNGDPMTVTTYDAGIGGFINGYPSILADRKAVYDPSDIFTAYNDHAGDFAFANLTATQTYNGSTKLSTVNVTANFAVNSTNDLRLACVYIEDGVHGTTTSYDQHNYYTGNAAGVMEGAGHNWAAEPNPVLAANMYYDHVALTILGGFTGQSASLPNPITGGNSYSHTFTYTIPTTSKPDNVSMIVLLINATTGQILNATTAQSVTGISDLKSQIDQLSIYPNPTTDELNVLFSLNKAQNVSFQITDVMGRIVSTTSFKNLAPTNQNIQLPVADLATGVYFLNIRTDSGIVSRRFVKN
ncbi:MAG: T9SS type A sorting domain-containing protein, partial [Bacteroidota bacterium]